MRGMTRQHSDEDDERGMKRLREIVVKRMAER